MCVCVCVCVHVCVHVCVCVSLLYIRLGAQHVRHYHRLGITQLLICVRIQLIKLFIIIHAVFVFVYWHVFNQNHKGDVGCIVPRCPHVYICKWSNNLLSFMMFSYLYVDMHFIEIIKGTRAAYHWNAHMCTSTNNEDYLLSFLPFFVFIYCHIFNQNNKGDTTAYHIKTPLAVFPSVAHMYINK